MDGDQTVDLPPGTRSGRAAEPRRVTSRAARRRRGALVAIAIIAVAAFVAAERFAGDPVDGAVRVAVVGDSLTMQSSWAIDHDLGAAGYLVAVSGQNGATIGDRQDQLISYTGFDGADVLVVALGTNDAYFQGDNDRRRMSFEQSVQDIDHAIAEVFEGPADRTWPLSVRCLVWVNLREDTGGFGLEARAPAMNVALAERAAVAVEEGHQVLVADWATLARGREEWFVADGVHLTGEGQRAFARLMAETVARCELDGRG